MTRLQKIEALDQEYWQLQEKPLTSPELEELRTRREALSAERKELMEDASPELKEAWRLSWSEHRIVREKLWYESALKQEVARTKMLVDRLETFLAASKEEVTSE